MSTLASQRDLRRVGQLYRKLSRHANAQRGRRRPRSGGGSCNGSTAGDPVLARPRNVGLGSFPEDTATVIFFAYAHAREGKASKSASFARVAISLITLTH